MADNDETFTDILDDDGDDTSSDSNSNSSGAATGEKSDESGQSAEERIRALQSRADKAEAELNKIRKQAASGDSTTAQGSQTSGTVTPELKEWLVAAEDRLREQLYREDPRFAAYELPPERITGSTPAEMRASAKDLAGLLDRMEQDIRAKVQREHGIAPTPSSTGSDRKVSFDKMSSDEFDKYVEDALRGL